MTTESPGYKLGLLLDVASPNWSALATAGDQSPSHQIVSQVIAILGGSTDEIEYISARIDDTSGPLADVQAEVVFFTADLILRSTLVKGVAPTLQVTRRDTIAGIDVRSAPVVTFQTGWLQLEVTVHYELFSLDLPFITDYNGGTRFERFFPKLVADLHASGN